MNPSDVARPTTRRLAQHLEMWSQSHQSLNSQIDEVQNTLARNHPPVQDVAPYLDAMMEKLQDLEVC